MLTPEQEQELKRFTAEKARVRKELRETQRGLDVDINRLGTWLEGHQHRRRAARSWPIAGVRHSVVAAARAAPQLRGPRRSIRHEPAAIHRVAGRRARGAICGPLYLSTRRNAAGESHGAAAAAVAGGRVQHRDRSLSVRKGSADARRSRCTRQGDAWTVAERGDYPADVSKLRKSAAVARAMPRSSRRKPPIPPTIRSSASRIRPSRAQPARKSKYSRKDGKHARHRRQAGRQGSFVTARGRDRAATSSSRRSPSKPNRAIGSTRGCSTSPPTRFKASNSSRQPAPAIRCAG